MGVCSHAGGASFSRGGRASLVPHQASPFLPPTLTPCCFSQSFHSSCPCCASPQILYVPEPRQVAHGNVSHITFNSLTLHVSGHDFYLKGADARHTRPVFASDRNTTCRPKDPMLFTEDRAFQMLGWPMVCTLDG